MYKLEVLEKLFDFANEDLQINRSGRLSERQFQRVSRAILKSNIDKWVSSLTWVMFLVTLIIFIMFNLRYGDQLGPLVLVDILIWLALVYVLSKLIAKLADILLRQLSNNQTNWFVQVFRNLNSKGLYERETLIVEQATGQLGFVSDGEHRFVMLGNMELTSDVTADTDERLWRLKENDNYTIYYLPNPLRIVAIEPA